MTMHKHTKWITIVVLLAICSQAFAAAQLPSHAENASQPAPAMDHATMDHAAMDHSAHGHAGHGMEAPPTEHSTHVHSGMSDHEERCKFNCDCALGSCFNGAQLLSLSGLTQHLSVESNFFQPGQIAESQLASPLYRPPIFR